MATVSKSFTGEYGASFVATFTNNTSNLVVSGATFNIDNLLPSMTAKITKSGMSTGRLDCSLSISIGGNGPGVDYYIASTPGQSVSWSSGASKTIPRRSSAGTLTTSNYFKASNKTQKSLALTYDNFSNVVGAAGGERLDLTYFTMNLSQTVTLNAPPTFAETFALTDDFSGVPYANKTTASVTLSSLAAYYGGDFTGVGSATFTIGSQAVTKANPANNDVLSINLQNVGTFTPTVSVTDSRGQTTTHTLNAITVQGYNAPSVSFSTERTTSTGTPDDEGAYAVIDTTFTFTDAIATLSAPTVAVTDDGGLSQIVSTTWYSSRAADGTLSGSVTWANLSSGDTVYGLVSITGNFNTQKSYQIAITPQDSEGTGTTITQTLGSAFYTVDFLAGGHGIAFGQPASQAGFFCNMDANFMQNVDIASGATYKVNGVDIVDFVITQNETTTTDGDGYWRWREWKSGKVEIWYHGTLTLATSTQTQGVYRTAKRFNFPNSYSLYKCTGIVNGADSGGWYNCGGLFNSSNVASEPYSKIEVMAYRISSALPTSASNVNIYICGEINN